MKSCTPDQSTTPVSGSAVGVGVANARTGANVVTIAAIDSLLPQTQCRRCGYPSCNEYARALASAGTLPNRCPPGGQQGADELARLLGMPPLPLDPECGPTGPRLVALIDPAVCIGCTKCIVACPVDAIIGGPKRMHTVLPNLCTGCELCLPPCPVDCIAIEALPADVVWSDHDARSARERFDARNRRLVDDVSVTRARHAGEAQVKLAALDEEIAAPAGVADICLTDLERKRRVVTAAIERAKARADARRDRQP